MSAKRLTRSQSEKIFLGVCGGIAEYFGIDPTIVRLLFVLSIFAGGAGPVAYVVLALVMPSGADVHVDVAPTLPAPGADRPSTLGEDVKREVDGAIAKATEGVDIPRPE